MSNYKFEEIIEDLNELEGKFRDTLSGGDWSAVSDPTYGSCYRATVTHNFGGGITQSTTFWDNGHQTFPMGVMAVNTTQLYVFMPVNTVTLDVVVN